MRPTQLGAGNMPDETGPGFYRFRVAGERRRGRRWTIEETTGEGRGGEVVEEEVGRR